MMGRCSAAIHGFGVYPDYRFWDKAAVYAKRGASSHTELGSSGDIKILKPADITWMQWVVFGEIVRVGPQFREIC